MKNVFCENSGILLSKMLICTVGNPHSMAIFMCHKYIPFLRNSFSIERFPCDLFNFGIIKYFWICTDIANMGLAFSMVV